MNVESVCTESELASHLAGQLTSQTKLLPPNESDATTVRQKALDEVLEALRIRTPPILEANLATPSELKRAVLYGAEMWLYYGAMSTTGDASVFVFKYREAKSRFEAAITGLTPTLSGGLRGNSASFSVSRR